MQSALSLHRPKRVWWVLGTAVISGDREFNRLFQAKRKPLL